MSEQAMKVSFTKLQMQWVGVGGGGGGGEPVIQFSLSL